MSVLNKCNENHYYYEILKQFQQNFTFTEPLSAINGSSLRSTFKKNWSSVSCACTLFKVPCYGQPEKQTNI